MSLETRSKAGRPVAAKDRVPRKTAARKMAALAAAKGLTPLEVMLEAMRHYAAPGPDGQPLDRDKAVAMAEKAAPFIHAKLSNVDASLRSEVTTSQRFVLIGSAEAPTPADWEKHAASVTEAETAAAGAKPVKH